jgi:hypothetical protein
MIERSEERIKQNGEVFTPLPLVDEILGKLPEDVWQPEKTFIDNSCGDGNFLVRVVETKIAKGHPALKALSTTFGVDLMPDNVEECRRRLLNAALPHLKTPKEKKAAAIIVATNIVCADALTYDYSFGADDSLLTW